ncbi:hypothetical protein [Olivibacter sp. XZL3]|uniref:hypothetical protein n=1 Tax=Olivibacter sp. XZL3 TaxID=1735116 RepID=UPI001065D329|nr:hypothetical protein [Olivibacter sp. XZL3]
MTAYLNLQQFKHSLITDHALSDAFIKRCKTLNLHHIQELLSLPREKAISAAYLDIRLFREWTAYLEEHHLLFLLQ